MKHDNFNCLYKKPFGAIRKNTETYFRIDADKEYKSCIIRLWTPSNKELVYKMDYKDGYYEINLNIEEIGLNWYLFIIQDFDYSLKFYGCERGYTAGEGQEFDYCPYDSAFQITCYDNNFTVPDWFKGKIMYQIFPDRFNKNETHRFEKKKYNKIHNSWEEDLGCTMYGADNFEYFGGNLLGIINKLDYIKDLNVGIIYLNPIFKSKSNHRYDVSTFMEIDEMLGYEEDFILLCKESHKRDIRVIIDVSWNHVGDDSIYFNKHKVFGDDGAYHNVNSKYREWFNIYPNGTYDCWWGFDTLPTVNKYSKSYRKHVKKVIEHWNNLGIDGFRLDVIDELPDDFLQWFRYEVKSTNNDLVIFGEVWDDATLKKGFNGFRTYLYGHNQDSVMNYVLRNILVEFISYGYAEKEVYHREINGYEFKRKYLNLISNYPIETVESAMNFLSTHDINRILTVFSNTPYAQTLSKEQQGKYELTQEQLTLGIKRLKLAWSMLLCLSGNPSLFYGDESGLHGYNDPYNRKPMNWSNLNEDLISWFKNINKIRSEYPSLSNADINFIYEDIDVIAFERKFENKSLIYVLNRSNKSIAINIENENISLNEISYVIYKKEDSSYVKLNY